MSGQMSLFETGGPVGAYGHAVSPSPPSNGTATSNAAAKSIKPAAGTLRRTLLDFLRFVGPEGATDEEMQHGTGMNPSTQRPRRGELQRMGLIEDAGTTRPTASGRKAVVWRATRAEN